MHSTVKHEYIYIYIYIYIYMCVYIFNIFIFITMHTFKFYCIISFINYLKRA
jgi:hypothetical protein